MSILSLLGLARKTEEKRTSLNNPRIPLSDPAVFEILDGGLRPASGVLVNYKTALSYPPIWKAINLISRGCGRVPLFVYKKRKSGGRDVDRDHPAWKVLRRPGPMLTAFQFKMVLTAHALLVGNGYSYIKRNEFAEPEELIILDPQATRMEYKGGRYVYITKDPRDPNREFELDEFDVLHIRNLGYNGLAGYSILEILQDAIGLPMAIQRYQSVFFKNNARPSMVLRLPYDLKDEEAVNRLRESWGNIHGGVDNSHRPAVLEGKQGAPIPDITILNGDNQAAQVVELSQEQIIQIADIFSIPPHKLGHAINVSYNSLEQENQSLLDDCFDPWFCTWEQECELKLLREREKEKESHIIEYKRQALLRADMQARYQSYSIGIQNGFVNRDEVRDLENMNPIPDGEGEKFFVPINMAIAGEEPPEPEQQPSKPEKPATSGPAAPQNPRSFPLDEILRLQREQIQATIDTFKRRVAEQVARAAKNPQKFNDWLETDWMERDHRTAFIDRLSPDVTVCLLCTRGSTENVTASFVDKWFEHVRSELNDLTGVVTATELESRVSGYWQNGVCHDITSSLLEELCHAG